MPRTSITPATPLGPYPTLQPAANALDIALAAADTANQNSFPYTGRETLIAYNTGAGAHTVTLTSVVDDQKRSGDITTYSLGAGEMMAFKFKGGAEGWRQTDGAVYFEADHAEVVFAILRD